MTEEELKAYVQKHWKTKELYCILLKYQDDLATKKISTAEKFKMLILHLVGRCLVLSREIIILCEAGYSDGAYTLTRTLYEQFIHVCFFIARAKDPDFNNYPELFTSI